MLEPIPLSATRTIASMRLSSHALRCEIGHWGTSDESGRLFTLSPKQVRESEYHTLIQCSEFDCWIYLFIGAFIAHRAGWDAYGSLLVGTVFCRINAHACAT